MAEQGQLGAEVLELFRDLRLAGLENLRSQAQTVNSLLRAVENYGRP